MRFIHGASGWKVLQAFGRIWMMPRPGGVAFEKKMGTGAGLGFSLWPDFKTYAILTRYDSHEAFVADRRFEFLKDAGMDLKTWLLDPVLGHGSWGGVQPFAFGRPLAAEDQVAVLTRASISRWKWPLFWLKVGSVGKRAAGSKGLLFAKGVGEYPLLEQATFSVWESQEALAAFAYKGADHAKVIRQTRKIQWYREELFVRFRVLSANGL